MKIIIYGLLIIILQSCATVQQGKSIDSDYEIAQQILSFAGINNWKEYGLISEPDNYNIDDYLNGFIVDTLDLRNYKFDFKSDRNAKWEYKNFSNPSILDKLKIIDDYSKIEIIDSIENGNPQKYIKISRPVYSIDGKYAVVYFNYFYNIENASLWDSYTAIFFKENDEWTMIKWIYTPIDDK